MISTVTIICVCQALPGATREKDATKLVLKDGQPDELSQLFCGQDNFSENPGLLNQTLPEFLAKWSSVLAGTGLIQLLALWTSCCPWRSAYSSHLLFLFHSWCSPGPDHFITLYEKKKNSQSFSPTF